MRNNTIKKGFTLVELSIVLVIIGLLIGGILVGQSLIESAKINAQIRQIQQYDIATSNFYNKIRQLPGDCNVCNHASFGAEEGNNNGVIDSGNRTPPNYFYIEPGYFFPDLYIMQILEGEFIRFGAGRYDIGDESGRFPNAKIGDGGVIATGNAAGEVFWAFIDDSSGINDYHWNTRMANGNFSPAIALSIDSKLDDGDPNNGDTQSTSATVALNGSTAFPFGADTDSSTTCIYNSIYNTSMDDDSACRLVIKSEFHK